MNIWLVMLLGGLLTYLTRLSFILLLGRGAFPAWLLRLLQYVPPAVLSAIIFPEVLFREGQLHLAIDNLRLLAALVAAVVAWRWHNALLTILTGMLTLYLLQALFA
jgi:branched-subunit amino acid transport protein